MEYKVVKSKRRTLSLEVTRELQVIVRAPVGMNKSHIDRFVCSHEKWILEKLDMQKNLQEKYPELSAGEKELLRKEAKEYILPKVNYYSNMMRLYPAGVKITSAKKRFGSCSCKNNLCFSLYLMRYPEEAVDYVIVHELAHIKEKNHSKNFYELVEKTMPDYRERQKLLKK